MALLTSIRPSRVWLLAGGLALASISFVPVHPTVAAQSGCVAASPVAPLASTPAIVAAVPTQAAAEQEVNPPGDIPDNQAFVPYTSSSGGYTISMPEGWARNRRPPAGDSPESGRRRPPAQLMISVSGPFTGSTPPLPKVSVGTPTAWARLQ